MWSYVLVDETGARLELAIDGRGGIADRSGEPPSLVSIGVRVEREPGIWACSALAECGAFDWRLSGDVLFCDAKGELQDVPAAWRRASMLDTEIRRITGLLQRFREHVAGLTPGTGAAETRALAALDSARFAAHSKRGPTRVDVASDYIGSNTAAQARYRDRLRAGLKALPPASGEGKEELEWPARVWRRRAMNLESPGVDPQ